MAEREQLLATIYSTYTYVVNFIDHKLRPYNLSAQQYTVLRLLAKVYPESLTMGQLKEKMANQNSDITRLTDRLIAKKLAVRKVNPQNRRVVNVMLTQEANQFVCRITNEVGSFTSIVSHLSEQEISVLNELLDKIKREPIDH